MKNRIALSSRSRRRARLLLSALATFSACSGARSLAAQARADFAAPFDSIFAPYTAEGSPGCVVGVKRGDGAPTLRAYGLANLETRTPLSPSSIVEGGSVSKQFTAAAVLMLAGRGRLALTDDVRKYVPELPEYGAPITIRHLLNHTSGLRDWGAVVAAAGWPRGSRVHSLHHALDVASRQRGLNHATGAEYLYTNTGYNLLAIVVQRVSGQSLAEFTRREIFEPLGMRSTSWRDDFTRVVPGRATAYERAGGGWSLDMPFENVYGNGGLLTTVEDLLLWNDVLEGAGARAELQARLGGRAFVEELERQGVLTGGRTIAYASGVNVHVHRGTREVSHSGSTGGYRAWLARYPEERLSVAMLCNAASVSATEVGRGVANVLMPGRVESAMVTHLAATPARLTAAQLSAVAGLYRGRRLKEALRVDAAGDVLKVDGNDMVPLSPTRFASRSGLRSLVVTPGAPGGRPRDVRLVEPSGDTLVYDPAAPAAPTPTLLAEYAGEYRSDEAQATYLVEVAGDSATVRVQPDVRVRLRPLAYADGFDAGRLGTLVFVRDDAGRVRGLTVSTTRAREIGFVRTGSRE